MGNAAQARKNALIAAFLVFQIAVPLTYYLGGRGDDERFSWRMFSTLRMNHCQVVVDAKRGEVGERRRLDPRKDVQVAWVNLLKRSRPAVVEKYLARSCELQDASEVRYRRACTRSDGTRLPTEETTRACESGQIARRELAP